MKKGSFRFHQLTYLRGSRTGNRQVIISCSHVSTEIHDSHIRISRHIERTRILSLFTQCNFTEKVVHFRIQNKSTKAIKEHFPFWNILHHCRHRMHQQRQRPIDPATQGWAPIFQATCSQMTQCSKRLSTSSWRRRTSSTRVPLMAAACSSSGPKRHQWTVMQEEASTAEEYNHVTSNIGIRPLLKCHCKWAGW